MGIRTSESSSRVLLILNKLTLTDFIVNLFAEIADFFINFWVDNVIESVCQKKTEEVNS